MTVYPSYIIDTSDSVLILCCAAFLGQSDVEFYRDCDNVVLVDILEDKLEVMKNQTYNSKKKWEYINRCMFDVIKDYTEQNRKFDIISVDPWTGILEHRLYDKEFLTIFNCTNKYLVVSSSQDIFGKYNIKNKQDITEMIKQKYKIDNIDCIDILKRSDYYSPNWKHTIVGGVYWLVFEKKPITQSEKALSF